MPYTEQKRRTAIRAQDPDCNVGDLTFMVADLIEKYRQTKGDSYQTFVECLAACQQAADEFRHVVVHPYENNKRVENGGVFADVNSY